MLAKWKTGQHDGLEITLVQLLRVTKEHISQV